MTTNERKLKEISRFAEDKLIVLDKATVESRQSFERVAVADDQLQQDTLTMMVSSFATSFMYRLLYVASRQDYNVVEAYIRHTAYTIGMNTNPNSDDDRSVAMLFVKSIFDEIIDSVIESTEEPHLVKSNQ